jgi:chemotaxis response regulator CheB
MPGFVARAGLADKVLPLDQIGPEIVRAAGDKLLKKEPAKAAKTSV